MSLVEFIDTELPDIVRAEDLTVTYKREDGSPIVVLDRVNFLIEGETGRFIVLLGPSGCGKSTILRCIAGLQEPNGGHIYINERRVEGNQGIGMVFQTPMGFEWRQVIDDVAFALEVQGVAKKERHERAMEMLQLVGLEEHAHKYSKSPDLSGGQLQRVAIARSLMSNPSLLLLDEPFGKLDVRTKLDMELLIKKIFLDLARKNPHTVFFMVTHDLSEAVYLADEIWVMRANPGSIVERVKIDEPVHGRPPAFKKSKKFKEAVEFLEQTIMNLDPGAVQP